MWAAPQPPVLIRPKTQPSSGEEVAELRERFFADAKVGPVAALFAFDETGLEEHFEVVANGRLAEAERFSEVADAGLVIGLSLDEAQKAEPGGVGDRFENRRELVGVLWVERPLEERRARGGDGRDCLHESILTEIDDVVIIPGRD